MSIKLNLKGNITFFDNVEDVKPLMIKVISDAIFKAGWSQKHAAEVLKIDQPKISHIKNRKVLSFSLGRLFKLLLLLKYKIQINLKSSESSEECIDLDFVSGKNNKAKFLSIIADTIERQRWTQKHAAEVLKLDQPKVSHIKNQKELGFSIERLMRFLILLDHDITISLCLD